MAQLSMRIDDGLRDQFARMAEENGMSQPQMFAQLMAQAEADELKAMVPEQATEIDAVRTHLNEVLEAYSISVKRSAEAYEIAADKVRGQLEALGTLTTDNKRLTEENKQLSLDLTAAQEEIKRLTAEQAKTQVVADEAEDIRKQLMVSREQMVAMREQHQDEIKRLSDELTKAQATASEAEKALVEAKTDHMAQIEAERKAHQDEIKRMVAEQARIQAVANEAESQRAQLTEARAQMTAMREQHEEAMARERQASHAEMMDALVKILQEHAK